MLILGFQWQDLFLPQLRLMWYLDRDPKMTCQYPWAPLEQWHRVPAEACV